MTKHYNVIVSGKVQGVFYRASTKQKADELGVAGFVENLPEGTVYMEAEGEQRLLDELVQWCKRGPHGARVDNVEVTEGELMNFERFEIKR
jgi:acylphosphatase